VIESIDAVTARRQTDQTTLQSHKHETLLLVDDELLVLHSMKDVLQELGYDIIKAKNGAQGLACFRRHQNSIDAIITDVTMPEMSSVEMFRQIRAMLDSQTPLTHE